MEQLTTPQFCFNRFQTVGSRQDTQNRNTAGVQKEYDSFGQSQVNFIEDGSSIDMPVYVRIT